MKLGPELRLRTSACLGCGKELDACSIVSDDGKRSKPKDGDVTICIYCGHLMAFDDNATFRDLTSEEMYEVAADPRLLAAMEALLHVQSKRDN